MRTLAFTFFAFFVTVSGANADSAWVEAIPGGVYEARLATDAAACPVLTTDKADVAMAVRAAATDKFPLLCSAVLPAGLTAASIAGQALPLPVANPQRILVLGDTGCRIKGSTLQACNDVTKWPFSLVTKSAAALKPDLVLHLGDLLYRENACPAGEAGCAGSPYGDNWISWQADFFIPAAPLLAVAPWVILRGNHEECSRAGPGFLRLLGPLGFDPAASCALHLAPYTVSLGDVSLVAFDDASAPDEDIDKASLPTYAAEIAGLAGNPKSTWLAAHRPIWGLIAGPLNIPIGGSATLIAAAGDSLIPPNVALMLSGHIHTFEAINYTKGVPPQIIAGNGGDDLVVTPKNLKGAIFQGHSGVSVLDGLSMGGFGFLLLTRDGAAWTIDLYDVNGAPERRCHFTPAPSGPGRVDCPASEIIRR